MKIIKSFTISLMAAILLSSSANAAPKKINVFACEPEWAALTREIGGNFVEVSSAISAKQDPHYVTAKPSLIAKIQKADLVICSGADLEVGWLPILLQKAGKNVQSGEIGNLMAANYVRLLEKPTALDRANGDVHPDGNPHLHLNPHNIALVAAELNKRLKIIDGANSKNYQKNYDDFSKTWENSIKIWESKAVNLRNVKLVTHHRSFSYLIDWLKLNQVATLEVKPGIPATAKHLQNLLVQMKNDPAQLIIRSPFDEDDASKWLSDKTKIKAVVLPYTVGGDDKSGNLFVLFDQTINLLSAK